MSVRALLDDEGWSGPRVVRSVPCGGHAFGEDLRCPCGATWFQHQQAPRTCRMGAQRCKRGGGSGPDPAE